MGTAMHHAKHMIAHMHLVVDGCKWMWLSYVTVEYIFISTMDILLSYTNDYGRNIDTYHIDI